MNINEALKTLKARNPQFTWGIIPDESGKPIIHFESRDYLVNDPFKDGGGAPADPLKTWGLDHESAEIMRLHN